VTSCNLLTTKQITAAAASLGAIDIGDQEDDIVEHYMKSTDPEKYLTSLTNDQLLTYLCEHSVDEMTASYRALQDVPDKRTVNNMLRVGIQCLALKTKLSEANTSVSTKAEARSLRKCRLREHVYALTIISFCLSSYRSK
jgi:hypothetical protein